jgi:hypothetical protein
VPEVSVRWSMVSGQEGGVADVQGQVRPQGHQGPDIEGVE